MIHAYVQAILDHKTLQYKPLASSRASYLKRQAYNRDPASISDPLIIETLSTCHIEFFA